MRLVSTLFTAAMCVSLGAGVASASGGPHFRQILSTLTADPTFTAAWGGVWTIDTVERDCTTNAITDSYSEQDTICAGSQIAPGDSGFPLVCDGTISDTSLSETCSGSIEAIPGCTATFTYTVSGTRSGDSLTGTATISIDYVGSCGPITGQCTKEEITGTRTGPEPGSCTTPVVPTTWGLLKNRYTD